MTLTIDGMRVLRRAGYRCELETGGGRRCNRPAPRVLSVSLSGSVALRAVCLEHARKV